MRMHTPLPDATRIVPALPSLRVRLPLQPPHSRSACRRCRAPGSPLPALKNLKSR